MRPKPQQTPPQSPKVQTTSTPTTSMASRILATITIASLTLLNLHSLQQVNESLHSSSDECHYSTAKQPALWPTAYFQLSLSGLLLSLINALLGRSSNTASFIDTTIPRIRACIAGYTLSLGLVLDVFMTIGTSDSTLLNTVLFILVTVCPILVPGCLFGRNIQAVVCEKFLAVCGVLSAFAVFYSGVVYGGDAVTHLLVGSRMLSSLGVGVFPPSKSGGGGVWNAVAFEVMTGGAAVGMALAAYLGVVGEAPCFPMEVEAQVGHVVWEMMGAMVGCGFLAQGVVWSCIFGFYPSDDDKEKIA